MRDTGYALLVTFLHPGDLSFEQWIPILLFLGLVLLLGAAAVAGLFYVLIKKLSARHAAKLTAAGSKEIPHE